MLNSWITIGLAGALGTGAALAGGGTCSSTTASQSACSGGTPAVANIRTMDIVDTAVGAGSFKTLVTAVKAAGLVDALKGDGPFTVFAPTDDAFAKLPAGTVETLLKPENRDVLTSILTYHVVPGEVPASKVLAMTGATTLNGQRIDISTDRGVMVDNAKVIKTDIQCSNGIIHVIDSVILPSGDDIITTAVNAGSFQTLATAIKTAGLVEALKGDGPFTVFAPTDAAFAKLPAGTVQSLLKPENRKQLTSILKFHVVAGRVFASDAAAAQTAETLAGKRLRFSFQGGALMVNGVGISETDIETSNGVIHVIDEVLLP